MAQPQRLNCLPLLPLTPRDIPTHRNLISLTAPERGNPISEHSDPEKEPRKGHEPHALHQEHAAKGPHDPKEINPKMASDIAYWAHEFHVSGDQLHEAIRSHGTHVDKVRAALHPH